MFKYIVLVDNIEDEHTYHTYHNKTFDCMCISEGIIMNIFKSLDQNVDKIKLKTLKNAIETLKYLEENDSLLSSRCEESIRKFSKGANSPTDLNRTFKNALLPNSRGLLSLRGTSWLTSNFPNLTVSILKPDKSHRMGQIHLQTTKEWTDKHQQCSITTV